MKLILALLLISSSTLAQDFFVQKLRGKAIFKGSKRVQLKAGKTYKGPGIIQTASRSFIKLKLSDGAQISLAPKSKIILKKEKIGTPSIINLLRGKLRAKLSKNKSESHKLYLKTHSASLGVRGTDFLVTYNDKNHITSTTTFSGNVEFHKETDKEIISSVKENFDQKTLGHALDKLHSTDFKDKLSSKKIVSIKKGQFSGSYPNYDIPLPPTKISPIQVKALKSNDDFHDHKGQVIYNKSHSRKKFKLTNKNLIPEPKSKEELEDASHDEKVLMAGLDIRQGGVLDLKTGMYIMPPKGSKFNKQTGLHELPNDYGGVDSKTGHYSPPEDVEVHHFLGFVKIKDGIKEQVDNFSKSVTKILDKYKKLTRVDLHANARYFYSYKSFENYYGEYKNVTDAESMIFNFDGTIGRNLYNNSRYLHYLKASLSSTLHNRRDEPLVQRNDKLVTNYGYEFHRKHRLLKRKANLIFDFNFKTFYMDFNNKDQFDYYSESANLDIYEKFQLSRDHFIELGLGIAAFQGHEDQNHGNMRRYFFKNKFLTTHFLALNLDFYYSDREDKISKSHYRIASQNYKLTYLEALRKTDLSLMANFEKHESRSNSASVDGYKAEIERRTGEHFKLNLFYEYLQNKSSEDSENRDFTSQLWGAGLKFIF